MEKHAPVESPSDKKRLAVAMSAMDDDMGFESMRHAYAQAKQTHPDGLRESLYILANRLVHMRIVGQRLAQCIHLPFAHLGADGTHPPLAGLTVELWDQSETNVSCQIGSTREDLDLDPILRSSRDGRYVSYQLQHSFVCFDRRANWMIGCISSAEELSLYERGRALHVLLTLWHNSEDVPVIHAGLVSKNNRGVLLAGPAGAGKSTSAVTCACAGFTYLSDDILGLQFLADGSFFGHSLYNSTFLEPDHLEHFPLLKPYAAKGKYPYEKKLLILLAQIFALRFERAAPIRAIALPRVERGRKSRFRKASKGEALLALAPSSILVGQRSPGIHGFNKLVQLVERVPCYWLEIGQALNEIPQAVEELLAEAASH